MPAIIPARLKLQSNELAALFSKPKVFMRRLVDLLENYADRTHRQSQSGTPNPLIASYHVPQPVIRQLVISLRAPVQADQNTAYDICDLLWAHPFLETRTLAAHILGWLHAIPEQRILEKLIAWQSPPLDDRLLHTIIQHGFTHLRKANPEFVMQVAQGWVKSKQSNEQQAGLIALETLIRDSEYENLPSIILAASPFFRKIPLELSSTVQSFLISMVERYPQETTYTLLETLQASDNPDTARLIRQVLSKSRRESNSNSSAGLAADLELSLRKSVRKGKSSEN